MRGMNKVFLVGRLGAEPELRHGQQGGNPWCTLSVATSRSQREGDDWTQKTEWHRVKAFGKQAEMCQQHLHKGSVVAVEGSLAYRQTEREGQRHFWVDVLADRVSFLPGGARA
ncbi:MAG: single-stranded DNA-binding protein [Deltaproteobacteria bacterium]|nr:single-stranded DNA-binding protein [Deltaproteobacteria bacterium]